MHDVYLMNFFNADKSIWQHAWISTAYVRARTCNWFVGSELRFIRIINKFRRKIGMNSIENSLLSNNITNDMHKQNVTVYKSLKKKNTWTNTNNNYTWS